MVVWPRKAVALIIGTLFSAAAFYGFCADSGSGSPQPQYLTFSHGVVRTVKEPSQHSRLGGSFGLGDVGDTLGIPRLGIGIGLDTFWAVHGGNQKTDVTMELTWNFSKADLNDYNVGLAGKYLIPHVPLGSIKVTTHEFHYQRQLGFSTKIGLDFNIKGTWHNNIGSQSIADLGIDINDTANEKIGPNTGQGADPGVYGGDVFYHSDTVMITDLATLANGCATSIVKIFEKIGISALKGYGAAVTKSLAEKALEKILSFSLGVHVTQRTYERWMEFDISATAKDMDGKAVAVTIDSPHIVVNDESQEYSINAQLPQNCPPLKEISLSVSNAKYHYKDQGNVEVGIRSSFIALTTGALSQGLFDPNQYNIEASNGVRYSVKADPLVFVPFHGSIVTGDPETALAGVSVKMTADNNAFVQSTLTGPDGSYYGDFYTPDPANSKVVPPYTITLEKEGYTTVTLKSNNQAITRTPDGGMKLSMAPSDPNSIIKVSGTVLDQQGAPIPEAEVSLNGKLWQWTVTKPDGTFVFGSVPRANSLTVSAQKSGYVIPIKTVQTQNGVKDYTVELKSNMARLVGSIKLMFSTLPGLRLPSYVKVRHENGSVYSCALAADGSLGIGVLDVFHKTISLSLDGYAFEPSSVSADFAGSGATETKTFNVTITPTAPHSITLSSNRSRIEGGGSYVNDPRTEETAVLTAVVKDAAGRLLPGVNVRFDLVSAENVGQVKFSSFDPAFGSGRGYMVTDAQGKASVNVWTANTTLANASIKLKARAFLPGLSSDESQVISNEVTVNVITSTRVAQPNKPTANVTVMTNSRAVTPAPQPTIEAGGEVIFHLSAQLGNPLPSPQIPAGTIVAYKLGTSKNNGAWQDTQSAGFPPVSVPQTFDQKGEYRVGFMVLERCGEQDVWSDRAEAPFSVVEYTPPTVALTVPSATGAVNLPVSFSFDAIANGSTLKNIILEFGDNKMDFDIDSGILSGKTHWSGSYHHIYDHEGTYTIRLKATDQNNRSSETAQTVTIGSVASLNDNAAPTGSITIENGASSTASRDVSVRITASDNSGGSGIWRCRLSNDGSNWSQWWSVNWPDDIPVASMDSQKAWQLSDGSGQKTVYVQLKDAAENVSGVITASIQLSASGLNISGSLPAPVATVTYYQNAPAPHGTITITGRSGNDVSAAFSATNDWAIAIDKMALSFDGTNWTAWMPFESNKQVSLAGHLNATKLYVTYADVAGGRSPNYSADIPAAQATGQAVTQQSGQGQATGQQGGQQATSQAATQAGQAQVSGQQGGQQAASSGAGAASGNASGARQTGAQAAQATAGQGRKITEVVRKEVSEIDIEVESVDIPSELYAGKPAEITAYIRNNSKVNAPDCEVRFESEDGFKTSQKLSLGPGRRERVRFSWEPKREGSQKISVAVEFRSDSTPANNSVSQRAFVKGAARPDVSIGAIKVPREIYAEKETEITVTLKNESELDIKDCVVMIESEDGFREKEMLSLGPRCRERVSFRWVPKKEGRQRLTAIAEAEDDASPNNNKLSETVEVIGPEKRGGLKVMKEMEMR